MEDNEKDLIEDEIELPEEESKEDNEDIILKEKKKEVNNDIWKEDNAIKRRLNYVGSDKKKNTIIIILVVIAVLLIGVILLLTFTKKDLSKNEKDKEPKEKEVVDIDEEKDITNMGYVSCDDNASSLNVRNAIDGDIIDSLSCYKEVTIEEKQEETENCKEWYKISYTKKGSNYTGYACGSYIKDRTASDKTIKEVKSLIDKVSTYYEQIEVLPYCGDISDSKIVKFKGEDDEAFEGKYTKSEYKTIDELKNYLLTFMDESLIKSKLSLSDYDNPKMYDDYYEIDGNLYCRAYSGKGFITSYTGNYEVEITSETEDKITANISYEYINSDTLNNEESKCKLSDLSSCNKSNLEYKLGKLTIEKKNNNFVMTKIDFHG